MAFTGSFVWMNATFRAQVQEKTWGHTGVVLTEQYGTNQMIPYRERKQKDNGKMVDLRTVFPYEFNYKTRLIL